MIMTMTMAMAMRSAGNTMGKPQVLVVEDDPAIRRGLIDALHFEGYLTLEAANGQDALDLATTADLDLILLDLVFPWTKPASSGPAADPGDLSQRPAARGPTGDGLTILRRVRENRPTLPVVILTARGQEADRVEGLKLGADDYVVKPFSIKELLARVQAVLRRSPQRPSDVASVAVPGGTIDLARFEIRFDDGERHPLSEREADLLRYLASHAGRVIARQELLSNVWRIDPRGVDTRTIDMMIVRLREKLRDHHDPRLIGTVRGKGYVWEVDVKSVQ